MEKESSRKKKSKVILLQFWMKYGKQNIFLVRIRLLLPVIQCAFYFKIFLTKCVSLCAPLQSVSPGPELAKQPHWGREGVSQRFPTLVHIGVGGAHEHSQCQGPGDLDFISPGGAWGLATFTSCSCDSDVQED